MLSILRVVSLLFALRVIDAQTTTAPTTATPTIAAPTIAAPTVAAPTIVDSSASNLGIFQLVTPTTHASQVPVTAIDQLSEDAMSFYTSYTQVDSFDFVSALDLAIQTLVTDVSIIAGNNRLITAYFDGQTSLLDNPTAYLARLHASASPYPAPFSSSLMSQATGILLGYESLVTTDVLGMNATQAPVTPGMSINVAPAVTGGGPVGSGVTQASQGTGTTSTSKAAGIPTAHANAQVMINAAAAAVGVLGVAWM